MVADFVINADDGYEPEDLPPIKVDMDGVLYTAYCPKDSLPMTLARLKARMEKDNQDLAVHEEMVSRLLHAVFDKADAEAILDRVVDLSERKITVRFVMHVVELVQNHYAPLLEAKYKEMGVDAPGRPQPQDRLPKASARRTSPRAAKATARRRAAD